MKKSIYPFLLLTLLLLVSCKSKKRMVATLPRLVLNTDSIVADTSNVIAGLFAPDHSQLKDLNVSKGRKRRAKKNKSSADAYKSEDWVLRGTKITSSEVDVSSVYSGCSQKSQLTLIIFCMVKSIQKELKPKILSGLQAILSTLHLLQQKDFLSKFWLIVA